MKTADGRRGSPIPFHRGAITISLTMLLDIRRGFDQYVNQPDGQAAGCYTVRDLDGL